MLVVIRMIVDDDGASGGESTPMEEAERTPPLPSQKAQILDIMAEKAFMEAGDVWYPISFRWWDAWRQYVGLEQEEDVKGSFSADENLFPGAIDNSGLQGDSDREIDKKVGTPPCMDLADLHFIDWLHPS